MQSFKNGTVPITRNRLFELVTPEELSRVHNYIAQQFRYTAVDEAVRYLAGRPIGSAVRVKVNAEYRLKRMRESAIGYAARRGFSVKTRHLAGWLYIIKGDN